MDAYQCMNDTPLDDLKRLNIPASSVTSMKKQQRVERLVKSGTIGAGGEGGVWNVLAYNDNSRDWYVVASIHQAHGKKNRYLRVGRYDSENLATTKASLVDPEKLSKSKKVGTIDLYRNRTWRVRIKYIKENLHIGYYVKKKDAHLAMLKLMNDTKYLTSRCEDLNRKREVNKMRLKRRKLNSGGEVDYAVGKKRWTEGDVILLTKLRDQCIPWLSVARRLGRTIEACKSRIWRQAEQSGRLAKKSKPFVKQITQPLTPPHLPFKRRREEDEYIGYNTIKYPASPRLDDDDFDDDDSPIDGDHEWFSTTEIKTEPPWNNTVPGKTEKYIDSGNTFPNKFFGFLQNDCIASEYESSKTSLFEIPSSSLNVEAKEDEKNFLEQNPWSEFSNANPFIPRFNPMLATKINEEEEWWLSEND